MGEELVGLKLLQEGGTPLFDEFDSIIEVFQRAEQESRRVYTYGGLGSLIRQKCLDPKISEEQRTRTVALELTKAFNGMLKSKEYQQNVFRKRAALRSRGLGSTCARLGGPLRCEPTHLPPRVSVRVLDRHGYPYMVLGGWTDRRREGGQ